METHKLGLGVAAVAEGISTCESAFFFFSVSVKLSVDLNPYVYIFSITVVQTLSITFACYLLNSCYIVKQLFKQLLSVKAVIF